MKLENRIKQEIKTLKKAVSEIDIELQDDNLEFESLGYLLGEKHRFEHYVEALNKVLEWIDN